MPGKDGSGPRGQGPGTGKGRGPCQRSNKASNMWGNDSKRTGKARGQRGKSSRNWFND